MRLLVAIIVVLAATAAARAAESVDAELVLAVDVSRSMDPDELELQRAGYVDAIRHPDFVRAVQRGAHGRIAMTYFEWASAPRLESQVSWALIDGPESAEAFATALAARPFNAFRGTSISGAIGFAADLFNQNSFDGFRRVIDVSGDGPNNIGLPVLDERQKALDAGIVINGLPILIRPSWTSAHLDSYYQNCVIGGPGAFVMPIREAAEFATAIRRKLIMEVSGIHSLRPIPIQDEQVDCLVGEKQRGRYTDPYFPELGR